jgi:ATP-dependent NAD(P)H-hydrate dehydratase
MIDRIHALLPRAGKFAFLGGVSVRSFRVAASPRLQDPSACGTASAQHRRVSFAIMRSDAQQSRLQSALQAAGVGCSIPVGYSGTLLGHALSPNRSNAIPPEQLLAVAECCVPELTWEAAKGGSGRLAVIGGSLEYTGAPYFAAAAMLRCGADLSHVFCQESAGTAIKGYSPELIVHPVLPASSGASLANLASLEDVISKAAEEVGEWVSRVDGLLIGPGLGRDPAVLETCRRLIVHAAMQNKPLLLDADGLFILTTALAPRPSDSDKPRESQLAMLDALKTAHLTLTPNKVEWERLCKAFDLIAADSADSALDRAGELAGMVAQRIGCRTTVIVKGPTDVISDGVRTIACAVQGSPRRAGGQGDVLAGLLLTFKVWGARAGQAWDESSRGSADGLLDLACAYAACEVARRSAAAAYERKHRSMLAGDVLDQVGASFDAIFPSSSPPPP